MIVYNCVAQYSTEQFWNLIFPLILYRIIIAQILPNGGEMEWCKHYTLTLFSVDRSKSVVAHLVHKAVEKYRGSFLVDAELSLWRVVVGFLDVSATFRAAADTHHPQELVDICNIHSVCVNQWNVEHLPAWSHDMLLYCIFLQKDQKTCRFT